MRVVLVGALLLLARSASAQPTQLPDHFLDTLVVGGLDFPVGMAALRDGRVLLIEQLSADIRLIVNGALATVDPVGRVPDVVGTGGERGLLGIAVDPRWPAPAWIYVYYDKVSTSTIAISRFDVIGDLAFTGDGSLSIDPASRYDLLADVPDLNENHNGGTLRFGPDGKLYASVGDDFTACTAQDTTSLLGKILRLDVSRLPPGAGGPAPTSLIAPADNPFAAHPDSNARLVWALGLRNPFRFHLDPLSASPVVYVADVGYRKWEEIDRAPGGGADFGWPLYEGPEVYSTCQGVSDDGFTNPIHAYDRTGFTAAVIGGPVYSLGEILCIPEEPCGFPGYTGSYFFSDYYAGFLRRLVHSGSAWSLAPAAPGQPNATDWGTGFQGVSDYLVLAGDLWYCRQSLGYQRNTGQIRRIRYAGPPPPPPPPQVVFKPPFPCPARGAVTVAYQFPGAGAARVELDLYDVRGSLVRHLVPPRLESGRREIHVVWDGFDEQGEAVPPGVYLACLRVGGRELARRFALIP